MFETPITIVGNIVTDPKRRQAGAEEVMRFRVASNARRRREDGTWVTGNSLFINVSCWGRMVTGVGAALGRGAPVIVHGFLSTSEYEDKDGNRRQSTELRATAVGPDLSRTIARIEKVGYTGKADEPAESAEGQSDTGGDDGSAAVNLPLSA